MSLSTIKYYYRFAIFLVLIVLVACANQPTATELTESIEPTHTLQPASPIIITPEEPEVSIACEGNLTSPNQEGPYYSPGSPERASLIEGDMQGVPVLILGHVFDQDCNPIPGARVDLWLADVDGEYDNQGYRLRGHVFADQDGYYAIESIEPGIYTGRPPHIHVKVFAPDGRELLTTQMYFPGSEGSADVQNAPDLFVTYIEPDENGRRQVQFDFVVQY